MNLKSERYDVYRAMFAVLRVEESISRRGMKTPKFCESLMLARMHLSDAVELMDDYPERND